MRATDTFPKRTVIGSNNGFVIHGPNDGFDGRPQYNNHHQQHQQQQQQQHPQPHQIVANNGYGNDVERFGGYQGQPQAQYYTGSAVIHPSQHGYSAPPVPAHFRGGQQPPPPPPPPQMVSMMQPSAQQAAVMYPQPQMYMPAMYLPMPAPVVVRQAPASTAPNSTVDSKNANKVKRNSQLLEEEPTSPSAAPSQHAPPPHVQTQPQQQQQPSEFGPNAYWNRPVSAPMMGYPATSYSPHQQQQMEMHHQQQQQQAQMQHHMQANRIIL
uniref:Uncharacterized protein n=1 Tax=Caenorhabditis japonica TaxID=281687 RepID=A0A8R1EQF5_CAEJA